MFNAVAQFALDVVLRLRDDRELFHNNALLSGCINAVTVEGKGHASLHVPFINNGR
jgi:hypothetical protein